MGRGSLGRGSLGPLWLCCCPELCLPLEATPEPHTVTGLPCPLLHLETPGPPEGAPASLRPSLLHLLSRGFTHFHPKPTSNFLTLVGNPQQRGGGFPEARFPSKAPVTVAGSGWDAAFWAHSSPHSEGRLCALPRGLSSAQTPFGARSPEGASRRSGHQRALLPRARPARVHPARTLGSRLSAGLCGVLLPLSSEGGLPSPPSEGPSFLRPLRSTARGAGLRVWAPLVWRCWEEWLGSLQVGVRRSGGAWGRAEGGRGWRPRGQEAATRGALRAGAWTGGHPHTHTLPTHQEEASGWGPLQGGPCQALAGHSVDWTPGGRSRVSV